MVNFGVTRGQFGGSLEHNSKSFSAINLKRGTDKGLNSLDGRIMPCFAALYLTRRIHTICSPDLTDVILTWCKYPLKLRHLWYKMEQLPVNMLLVAAGGCKIISISEACETWLESHIYHNTITWKCMGSSCELFVVDFTINISGNMASLAFSHYRIILGFAIIMLAGEKKWSLISSGVKLFWLDVI